MFTEHIISIALVLQNITPVKQPVAMTVSHLITSMLQNPPVRFILGLIAMFTPLFSFKTISTLKISRLKT